MKRERDFLDFTSFTFHGSSSTSLRGSTTPRPRRKLRNKRNTQPWSRNRKTRQCFWQTLRVIPNSLRVCPWGAVVLEQNTQCPTRSIRARGALGHHGNTWGPRVLWDPMGPMGCFQRPQVPHGAHVPMGPAPMISLWPVSLDVAAHGDGAAK